MLSKIISVGTRIELQAADRRVSEQDSAQKKVYNSKVYDILSEDTLEILMPMEKTKLVLLPVDGVYDVIFYAESGMYECSVRVIDRYKSNNIYLLMVELASNLRKYQRREYYRFNCALEMYSRLLQEEELEAVKSDQPYVLTQGLPMGRGIIVDISGGGLRFISTEKYEPGSMIYINYYLQKNGQNKLYEMFGNVLSSRELGNRPGSFECRVQYYGVNRDVREEIIKYIFEEERKNLSKEAWINDQKNSGS